MESQSNELSTLVVGITDDILEPIPGGPTPAPVILSAQDAAELFTSFQRMVYLTALLSAGSGRRRLRELTDIERNQFELLIEDVQIGSFLSKFRIRNDKPDLWNSADRAIDATIHWSSEVARRLGNGELLSTAAEVTPDALIVVSEVMLPIIQAYAGHTVYVDVQQAIAIVSGLAALVRISKRLNRRIVTKHGDREWKPTKTDVDGIIREDEALKALHERRFDTETRSFNLTPGTVTDTDVAKQTLLIRFPQYAEPIPCQYFQPHFQFLRNLQAGDSIEIEGFALHIRGDSEDAKPLLVRISDWGKIQHHFTGQYKM